MNSIFQELSWSRLTDVLYESDGKIRLILPALHEEWATLLQQVKNEKDFDIKVCINNSEKYIRDGYGDEKAIDLMNDTGIEIRQANNNRISFISNGLQHYFYFPTSRVFERYDEDGEIMNAIEVDEFMATQTIYTFFPEDKPDSNIAVAEALLEKLEKISNEKLQSLIKPEGIEVKECSKTLDKDELVKVKKSLKLNPPQHPDLKRQIEVYTMKIQFVELNFKNGNISGKRIKIPEKALPFQSPELKRILESSMKIFQNDEENQQYLEGYKTIQQYVKTIRETYLKNIRCRNDKSVLEKAKREAFEKEIAAINLGFKNVERNLIIEMDNEITKTQERLTKELKVFFLKNPPDEFKVFEGETLVRKIDQYAKNLVYYQMKFPQAVEIVQGMKLDFKFYDLTWEDLSDEELLKEFEVKDVLKDDIQNIRELKRAFAIRK